MSMTGVVMPIEAAVIRDYGDLQELQLGWMKLAKNAALNNFFATWEFISSWWESYGEHTELFVITCRLKGELVGIAPLYRKITPGYAGKHCRTLYLIGDGSDDVDGCQFLISPTSTPECLEVVLRFLSEHSEDWDLLDLNAMAEDHARTLEAQIEARGWIVRRQQIPHLVVSLPGTWESYLKKLSVNQRTNILRRLRKAEESFHLQLRYCDRPDEIDSLLDVLFGLHEARWRDLGKLRVQARQKFYRTLCARSLTTGSLDLSILQDGDKPLAALLGFRSGDTRYQVLHGRDPELDAHSIGIVIHAMVLRQCMHDRLASFDFLSGADTYKLRLGSAGKQYSNLRVARPNTTAGVSLSSENATHSAKRWIKTRMPACYRLLKATVGKR